MPQPALIIFVKNPELGKVKTRLASTLGDAQALRIYEALLGHTRTVVQAVPAQRLLFYSDFIATDDAWPDSDFEKFLQTAGWLGERMSSAFATAFIEGGPVLIVGSDCAQLTTGIVEQALAALQDHDFVLGPAEDGGYYLLGMQHYHPEVFNDIAWSTERVFDQTVAILQNHSWSYALTPTLSDIDFEEDWVKHGWVLGGD
jgi:uncharacterized protein